MAEVGVLALQGASRAHVETLARLGRRARAVRRPSDLEGLTHLVLPGGESTTLHRLLVLFGLWPAIPERHRAGELCLFGTCAGAILMGRDAGEPPPRWGVLDAELARNAYGPQVHSDVREVWLEPVGASLPCVFIRAPKVTSVGPGARALARDGGDPVLVEGPGLLASTFHPELTGDPRLHEYFLSLEAKRRVEGAGTLVGS